LNDLASTINQWEDDLSHPDFKKKPQPETSAVAKVTQIESEPKTVDPATPGVTKLTKTESMLTETTTTILMTTINKTQQGDEVFSLVI